jgi:hypothetical protein
MSTSTEFILSVAEMSTSTEFILSVAEGLSDRKRPNHLGDCYKLTLMGIAIS